MNNEQSTILVNDNKHKIVFLGDAAVGKTSIVQYITHGSAKTNYQATICLQSAKKLVMHNNQVYKLMLWDTAGQEKFHSLIPSFVRGCDCAVIVYDVTSEESLQNCQTWLKMVRNQRNQNEAAVVLVGNKVDLQRSIPTGKGFELAIKHKLAHVETSAKSGKGIQKLVEEIIENMEKNRNKSQKQTRSSQGDTHHKLNCSQKLNNSQKLSASRIASGPSSELKIKPKSSCCSV